MRTYDEYQRMNIQNMAAIAALGLGESVARDFAPDATLPFPSYGTPQPRTISRAERRQKMQRTKTRKAQKQARKRQRR